MEVYSTFQIKDHYYWVEEVSKPAPAPKPQPTQPAAKPTYKTTKVREADGSITYYDTQVSKPVVMPGGIWV